MKSLEKLSYKIYLVTLFISFASLLFFTGFYIYKIITNIGHKFYIIAYIVFLALTLLTAVVELIFRRKKDDDKETKKEKKLKRKRAKFVIRIIKYLVKTATIVIAIMELITISVTVGKVVSVVLAINMLIFEITFTVFYLIAEHKLKKFKESLSIEAEESSIKKLFHK